MFPKLLPSTQLRQQFAEIAAARIALTERETRLVTAARAAGFTWAELGELLGLTAHGARKRHLAADLRRSHSPDCHLPFIYTLERD